MHYLLGTLLAVVLLVVPVGAVEQRCTDLGANCICSEPLQATTYVQTGPQWNPSDSTGTQQCTMSGTPGVDGKVIDTNLTTIGESHDATALAALPAGHSVSRFLSAGPNHRGIFWIGNMETTRGATVRYAMRWYEYMSPDFQFGIKETSCYGDKLGYVVGPGGSGVGVINGPTAHNYYGFPNGVFDNGTIGTPFGYYDCCHTGPISGGWRPNGASMLGKWVRYEIILTKRDVNNQYYNMRAYYTNVTDNPNGAATKFIDLTEECYGCGYLPYPWSPVPQLIPKLKLVTLVSHYREGTSCAGWNGTSHLMYAAWDTDAGQFIGPAVEIEGGGAPPTPSTGVFNSFTVSSILIFLVVSVAAASMICMILGIAAVRRRYVERHANDWPDPPAQPLGAMPLDGPPTSRGHDVQPVVSDARADELVGVGREMEGAGAARERVG